MPSANEMPAGVRGFISFHIEQNISLYAFVDTDAVLVKKKGRGILAILRPFPVGM